jgi:plasmid stability protein
LYVGPSQRILTHSRDTLVCVIRTRNLTVNLPEQLLRQLRVCAAVRNQSMTSLVKLAIRKIVDEDGEAEKAKKRLIARLRNAPDIGLQGKISWTREELHER